ncbi:MAG: penicillin-binding protein 2 [Acetatifactor sp.]|nr:penicillin-binding protein 2 [Acetatifactor sp.]
MSMEEWKTKKFTSKMQKKLLILFLLILVAFAGLSVNLFRLVQENETSYQKQVLSQQISDSKTIPYRRGDIVDAKGTILATSEKVYNLQIDAYIMQEREAYLEPTLKALSENFPQLDITEIRSYVKAHPESRYYIALRQLSFDEISGFKTAQGENGNIQGVYFEEEYKRVYPNGSLAADVIGFARSDNEGQYGLEEYYNDILNGTPGREYGYLNESDEVERTVKAAIHGYRLHSTIDTNIQSIIEKCLKEFNETYKDGAHEGNGAENVGCIIMRINTGEVLGMASYPTYDLNNTRDRNALLGSPLIEQYINENGYTIYRNTHTIITQEVLDSLDEEQVLLNLNNLWKNFCISNTYEPGSTAKPFTVAAALETGAILPTDSYECHGIMEVGGHDIKCHSYKSGGEGVVTVQDSIAWSCNVALMKIGAKLGREEFSRFQNIFNFGLKTNIDLAGEARTVNLLFPAADMKPADLATNSFGQNFNVTMIQMIAGYCSLINGGYYYEPHLVNKITNSNGAVIKNIEPRVLKQTVSASTSEFIRQSCRAVVMEEGGARRTGKTARPAGYAIGGKTGTAETLPRDNDQYVVSFMGYAPADDPQIAIYVVVDRPNVSRQDDAKYATKIVRDVLTEVLPYLNIFMTEELSDTERAELQERQLAITTMYAEQIEQEKREALEAAEAAMAARDEGLDPNIGDDPGEGEVLGDSPANPNLSGDNQVQEPPGNAP